MDVAAQKPLGGAAGLDEKGIGAGADGGPERKQPEGGRTVPPIPQRRRGDLGAPTAKPLSPPGKGGLTASGVFAHCPRLFCEALPTLQLTLPVIRCTLSLSQGNA